MQIQQLLFKNYLTVIKNSMGTNMFRNFYVLQDGVEKDVVNDGQISCAFYLSNILHMFPNLKLISGPHATVASTVKDMLICDWEIRMVGENEVLKSEDVKVGSVLHWETGFGADGAHDHIGFYLGNGIAISHSDKTKSPAEHNWTFDNTRKVIKVYWHKNLV